MFVLPPGPAGGTRPVGRRRRMAVSSTRNLILHFKSSCGPCAAHLGIRKVGSLYCVVRFLQERSGMCPGCAQGAPRVSQGAQDAPSMRPGYAQDAPRMPQGAPRMRPGWPRMPQHVPRVVQHVPRMRLACAQGAQDAPSMRPGCYDMPRMHPG